MLVATASSAARTPFTRNRHLFEPRGKAGNVQIWDWKTGKRVVGPIPMPTEPRGLAFRPSGSTLAVVCADYHVVLVDPRTGSLTGELDPGLRTRPQNANQWFSNGEARFTADGRFLVTWEMTPHVHVWDPDGGRLLHTLPHTERVRGVSFNPTAPELLATCPFGTEARIWNIATGQLVGSFRHPHGVTRVDFSPDGSELITAGGDGTMRVFDWKAGTLTGAWRVQDSIIQDFRVTAAGHALVTLGHNDLQVVDWRTKTPLSPLWDLRPHFNLALDIPARERRAIVGGFSGALVGHDLDSMLQPADTSAEELVLLAEVVSARRILSQGNIVTLGTRDWLERWRQLQQNNPTLLSQLAARDQAEQDRKAGWAARDANQEARHLTVSTQVTQAQRNEAALLAERAVKLAPREPDYWTTFGLACQKLNDHNRAGTAFKKAAELAPGDPVACNNLAWLLATRPESAQREPRRAVELARKALELAPKDGDYWNTLGVALYRAGEYKEAVAALEKSLALQGDNPFDWFFLAMAHGRLTHGEQARRHYDQAVQWMQKHLRRDEELERFRAEAEQTLGINHNPRRSP
jgi:tetratricopeptide (TPR) repeat protein